MKDKLSVKKHTKWIQLSLYNNCFKDGSKTHLGFKHKGIFYCLTHSKSKVKVPTKALRMNKEDVKGTYICKAVSKPKLLNLTNMRISKLFFYNEFIKPKKQEIKNDISNIINENGPFIQGVESES